MASLSSSRAAAAFASSVCLLTALPAGAQSASPPPYGGYAPYAAPVAVERNSTGMMAGGITLITVGSVGSIIGAALLAAGTTHHFVEVPCAPPATDCFPTSETNGGLAAAGATMVAASTAALIVGIPLLAVGMRRVPARNEAAVFVPELRLGATFGSLRWRF